MPKKILLIHNVVESDNLKIDYMVDMIIHSLIELGRDYKLYTDNGSFLKRFNKDNLGNTEVFNSNELSALKTRGYGICFKNEEEKLKKFEELNKPTIEAKIRNKEFDLIIWPTVKGAGALKYLNECIKAGYARNQLVVVDGADKGLVLDIGQMKNVDVRGKEFFKTVTYYKREISDSGRLKWWIKPISFKFPAITYSEIKDIKPSKEKLLASCDPRLSLTYTFKDEINYYRDYKKSLFAYTTKKGGWDCFRHYEILANNCMPIFPNIEEMPNNTMIEWDRELQLECNLLWEKITKYDKNIQDIIKNEWVVLMKESKKIFEASMLTTSYHRIFEL